MGESELQLSFTRQGEVVVTFPDGTRHLTGLYPSAEDADLLKQFFQSSVGRSMIMQLRQREVYDGLTKLLLRAPARAMINRWLERYSATGFEGMVSVLVLDLDHFGHVNKKYGQTTGDSVLQWFANLLSRNTRGTDIAARWGGEEFVVFCPARKETGEEHRVVKKSAWRDSQILSSGSTVNVENVLISGIRHAERILHATQAAPCQIQTMSIPQTVTIGIAGWYLTPDQSVDGVFDILFERADKMLRTAKTKDERNRVHEATRLFARPNGDA